MSPTLEQWERAEVERSAVEAAHADTDLGPIAEKRWQRYVAPPADTIHPLEYAFHLLGDVRGQTILEYGCGDGANTLMLAKAKPEAKLISLDISPDLIEIARQRLRVNGITDGVELIVGSAHDLPLPDESVDVVFGIAILHHLDLALAAREVKRVLRKGGRAIFQEPVRNSKLIAAMRGLIPYRAPDVSPFERPLTDKELRDFAQGYATYRDKPFGLPSTSLLYALLPPLRAQYNAFGRWDAALMRTFPALSYYSPVRVIEMVK